tara:strand:+ start:2175 stop:2549 length:375 start_codon:yes stop_codon:yes gene_type:complete
MLHLNNLPTEPHPEIINRTVSACHPPLGSHNRVVERFGNFVRDYIRDLYHRAFIQIRDIDLEAATYEHAESDTSDPPFPNGYPVIAISFNHCTVAVVGLTFNGNQCAMKRARTKGSKLLIGELN